jgi:glycosyltransferase involved in cell wall biosynthesis
MSAMRRLRIAQVAPPVERVPPAAYGGTERVVYELTTQLVERGHDVALFASGDSQTTARLVPTVDRALRPAGIESDAGGWFATTVKMVVEQAAEFDVIHSHLEWWSIPLARLSPIPVVATFHGRLDLPWADRLLRDAPDGMVAISRHQASTHPDVPWTIIHNGLTLERAPFLEQPGDAFCFVGRVDAEKGIIEAIDIALRAGRRLRIAAKVGNLARQRDYYENVFRPALQRAGRSIEYLGEIQPAERDQLFAESYATLMPGAWPEPFGLVSIESLACGTPVLARRVGALPEIIREGVDGFFGDDAVAMAFFADRLGTLDRREIRERVIERFSAARMTDRYEELYTRMVQPPETMAALRDRTPDAEEVAEALAEQLPSEVTEPSDARLPGVPDVTDASSDEAELEASSDVAVPEAASGPAPDAVAVHEATSEPEPEPEPIEVAEAAEAIEPGLEAASGDAEPAPQHPQSEAEDVSEAVEAPIAVAVAVDVREPEVASVEAVPDQHLVPDMAMQVEEPAEEPVLTTATTETVGEPLAPEGPSDVEPQVAATEPAADLLADVEEARPATEASSAAESTPTDEPRAALAARPPVAVGPGPSTPSEPRPMVPPASSTTPTPTTPASPKPAAKPAAKRPSRTISIFTRQWSGSSNKATSSRRRDRS